MHRTWKDVRSHSELAPIQRFNKLGLARRLGFKTARGRANLFRSWTARKKRKESLKSQYCLTPKGPIRKGCRCRMSQLIQTSRKGDRTRTGYRAVDQTAAFIRATRLSTATKGGVDRQTTRLVKKTRLSRPTATRNVAFLHLTQPSIRLSGYFQSREESRRRIQVSH